MIKKLNLFDNKKAILKDSNEALLFMFKYIFYQGRPDSTSDVFRKRAETVLNNYNWKTTNIKKRIYSNSSKEKEHYNLLEPHYRDLLNKLKIGEVNKTRDRYMVADLINFIQSNCEDYNILRYIIENIKSDEIKKVYEELDSIISIGHKISSFTLRDIVYIYNLEKEYIKSGEYGFVFPLDTWVVKVSNSIGILTEKEKKKTKNLNGLSDKTKLDISSSIAERLNEKKINPIHYNQGAWYFGSWIGNIGQSEKFGNFIKYLFSKDISLKDIER